MYRLAMSIRMGVVLAAGFLSSGCVAFEPVVLSEVAVVDRPALAILPFEFDLTITKLSYLKTIDETLPAAEETRQLADALTTVRAETRWLFLSRLATAHGFHLLPLEQTDALAAELEMRGGVLPTTEQLAEFRRRLGADLVVSGRILDYGKIRWQWLVAGMLADISWETVVIGLATAWNPSIILGNVGYELLTSTPLWFGGGYLFGVSFRPVRVEARAFETGQGDPVWQSMDESAYAWTALKALPEEIPGKKEVQLQLNLAEIMETLADSLIKKQFTASALRARGGAAATPASSPP
jgi:hypothetical protein